MPQQVQVVYCEAMGSSGDSVKIGSSCTICTEAVLQGDVTIGAGTIIHPRAQIIAESGPIVIGENNLIEENAQLINRHSEGGPMTVGSYNVFEVGCRVEATRIGDNNIVEPKAVVGPNVELSNGCILGAMCELVTREILPENTVIFGRSCQRKLNSERPAPQVSQLDYLRKALPNYHYLMGVGKKG